MPNGLHDDREHIVNSNRRRVRSVRVLLLAFAAVTGLSIATYFVVVPPKQYLDQRAEVGRRNAVEADMIAQLQVAQDSGDLARFVDIAGEFATAHPDNHLVLMQALHACLKAGDPGQAITFAEECRRRLEPSEARRAAPLAPQEVARFWSYAGAAYLQQRTLSEALFCYERAAQNDARYSTSADVVRRQIANVEPNPKALPAARPADDWRENADAEIEWEVDVDGVLSLSQPWGEEVNGRILAILKNGSVVLRLESVTNEGPRILEFLSNSVHQVFWSTECERIRIGEIRKAGFEPSSLFPQPYYFVFRDPNTMTFRAIQRGPASPVPHFYATTPDMEVPISEAISAWRTLDAGGKVCSAPYTWTRELAAFYRKNEGIGSFFLNEEASAYLNLPVGAANPYPPIRELTEAEKKLDGLLVGMAFLGRTMQDPNTLGQSVEDFLGLSVEKQESVIKGFQSIARAVQFVVAVSKHDPFASFGGSDPRLSTKSTVGARATSRRLSAELQFTSTDKPVPNNTEVHIVDETFLKNSRGVFPPPTFPRQGRFSIDVPLTEGGLSPGSDPSVSIWVRLPGEKQRKLLWQGTLTPGPKDPVRLSDIKMTLSVD